MFYREYPVVHPLLERYIDRYWTISFSREEPFNASDLVLPDGGVEWVFSAGDGFIRFPVQDGQSSTLVRKSILVGPRTRPVSIRQTLKNSLYVIRFKPYGLAAITHLNMEELTDTIVDADLVFPPLTRYINQLLDPDRNFSTIIPTLEKLLVKHLVFSLSPAHLSGLWHRIIRTKGQIAINKYCGETGIHKSTLERLFKRHTGLTPKRLAGIIRMNHVVIALRSGSGLTDVAYQNGYYDQAHMIHDFKKYVGVNPTSFRRAGFLLPETLAVTAASRRWETR